MDRVSWALARLDLEPVMTGALLVMLVLRYALWRSLQSQRELKSRMSNSSRVGVRETLLGWLDPGLLTVFVLLFIVRPGVLQVIDTNSAAMEPTLHGSLTPQIDGPNDHVLVNKYIIRVQPLRRGQLVAYAIEDPGDPNYGGTAVRRVIALPGDQVEIDLYGRVLVNQQLLDEPYANGVCGVVFPSRKVPGNAYFLLGDNRGSDPGAGWLDDPFVSREQMRGRAVAIVWPAARAKLLE